MFYFFNDPATTEIYTLSLHDALPIFAAGDPDLRAERGFEGQRPGVERLPARRRQRPAQHPAVHRRRQRRRRFDLRQDRKSTRLNSSHGYISYAVFCLKKKNIKIADYK